MKVQFHHVLVLQISLCSFSLGGALKEFNEYRMNKHERVFNAQEKRFRRMQSTTYAMKVPQMNCYIRLALRVLAT